MTQTLAQKYRPRKLSQVVGQSRVIATVQRAIDVNRVFSCWLFSGSSGVGKTTVARILANQMTDIPSDIIEIDAASYGSVADMRELKETIQFSPVGQARVVIIDEAHMMSSAAFDALLKVMEEMPDSSHFILVTSEIHRIPETILSRCLHLSFADLDTRDIVTFLEAVCLTEKIVLPPDVLVAIASFSYPSLRQALNQLEEVTLLNVETYSTFKDRFGDYACGYKIVAAATLGKQREALSIAEFHANEYGADWTISRITEALVGVCKCQTGVPLDSSIQELATAVAYNIPNDKISTALELVWQSIIQSKRLDHKTFVSIIVTLLTFQLSGGKVETGEPEPAATLEDFK